MILSERDFCVQWRKLFDNSQIDDKAYALADELIDALPQTSPLRQRYSRELSDLQRLKAAADKPAVGKAMAGKAAAKATAGKVMTAKSAAKPAKRRASS